VPTIGREDFLRNKRSVGPPRDLADVADIEAQPERDTLLARTPPMPMRTCNCCSMRQHWLACLGPRNATPYFGDERTRPCDQPPDRAEDPWTPRAALTVKRSTRSSAAL
jgi:hypothetical protein